MNVVNIHWLIAELECKRKKKKVSPYDTLASFKLSVLTATVASKRKCLNCVHQEVWPRNSKSNNTAFKKITLALVDYLNFFAAFLVAVHFAAGNKAKAEFPFYFLWNNNTSKLFNSEDYLRKWKTSCYVHVPLHYLASCSTTHSPVVSWSTT